MDFPIPNDICVFFIWPSLVVFVLWRQVNLSQEFHWDRGNVYYAVLVLVWPVRLSWCWAGTISTIGRWCRMNTFVHDDRTWLGADFELDLDSYSWWGQLRLLKLVFGWLGTLLPYPPMNIVRVSKILNQKWFLCRYRAYQFCTVLPLGQRFSVNLAFKFILVLIRPDKRIIGYNMYGVYNVITGHG